MKRISISLYLFLVISLAIPVCGKEEKKGTSSNLSRTPDVVFVPTPQETVDKMLEMAEIQKGDVLYDLGCGDGRIVVTAAKKYGIKAIGFDIDPKRIAESRENVKTNNIGHLVEIRHADIFEQDLAPANVVTMYLLPSLNVKLIPQLQKLKPGSRIVSHSFDMAGVKPVEVVTQPNPIYKWIAPIRQEANETGEAAGAEKAESTSSAGQGK